jgi:hypothetical protein
VSDLKAHCFNPDCDETFESVNQMVGVAGRGGRSPRHFCESCAERIQRGPPMTDGGRDNGTDHYLYAVTLGCPNCDDVIQVVEATDSPVALDMDVPLSGYSHCPMCGIHLPSIGKEWDVRSEHEIETVTPTQERSVDTATEHDGGGDDGD